MCSHSARANDGALSTVPGSAGRFQNVPQPAHFMAGQNFIDIQQNPDLSLGLRYAQ